MKVFNYVLLYSILCGIALAKDPVNVGGRRELFLDDVMVERMVGGTQRVFHRPVAREVVMKYDKPWEGNSCGDSVVFRDGDIYRMYYRALDTSKPPGFTCYAESRDGIHWNRPDLDLVEFNGSKTNNIVLQTAGFHDGNLMVFRDENPSATPDALYKAVGAAKVAEYYASTACTDPNMAFVAGELLPVVVAAAFKGVTVTATLQNLRCSAPNIPAYTKLVGDFIDAARNSRGGPRCLVG